MSPVNLFRKESNKVHAVKDYPFTDEDELHLFFEQSLHELTGITFLTSKPHFGTWRDRELDMLGLDEDGCPVVIEFKHGSGDNAINQGLEYLDFLLTHEEAGRNLVRNITGTGYAREINVSKSWLLCIAGSFKHEAMVAAVYCRRRVELLQYRRFDEEHLVLNWVLPPRENQGSKKGETKSASRSSHKPLQRFLQSPTVSRESVVPAPPSNVTLPDLSSVSGWKQASEELRALYMELCKFILAMGPEVSFDPHEKKRANFRNNFIIVAVYLKPRSKCVQALAAVKPDSVPMERGFTHDTGGLPLSHNRLAITIRNRERLERAKPILQQAYEHDLTGEAFRWDD